MTTHSFSALGTTWWIEIFSEQNAEQLQVTYTDLELFVYRFEQRYSRFRTDSLISQLNHDRIIKNPDSELQEILHYGLTWFTRSYGLFNLLIGETLAARGYDATYSFTPKKERGYIPSPVSNLSISPSEITLDDGQIDIGGYGKGYLIDLLADRLQTNHRVTEFLINGGGDMYGTSEDSRPITLYLEDPLKPGNYLGKTAIYNQGFAASSPHKRAWVSADTTYTHIVDPKPGLTSPQFDAAFIIADTACLADVVATVALFASEADFIRLAESERFAYARYLARAQTLTKSEAFKLTPIP